MAKPRIIVADTDAGYIQSLQLKFIEEFFEKIDLEIITDEDYFETLFSSPQKAEVLIVSEDLYSTALQKHNISHIFLLTEHYEDDTTGDLNVGKIYKYTSIKEIFNEILGKSADSFNVDSRSKKETQIVVVTSATGGVGKTTVAMGLAGCLAKNYKRVLYLNTDPIHTFQFLLKNPSPITSAEVYSKLARNSDNAYGEIKHLIRNEVFSYLPPFRGALMSIGIEENIFIQIANGAKRSGDYDFIVIDSNSAFDDTKASLLEFADRVIFVTNQSRMSVSALNVLVNNINGIHADKYVYICNNFDKESDNALISADIQTKFQVNEYIEHIDHYDGLLGSDFAEQVSFQKASYLLL